MKVAATLLSLAGAVAATTIAEINGNKFLSPLQGQNVTAVEGLVLAKGPNGVWIRSTVPDDDDLTSEALLTEKHKLTSLSKHSLPATERYSYVFDGNAQQLDHMLISPSLVNDKAKLEHIHVSSWRRFADVVSDHDPAVGRLNVCGC
ncbi:hypothetical protein BN1708_016051 [Verticillium longisporum]|uniref:Endonuclease/exonuclease/phosphatase domain-containing protein n=1 Tax=Verticillium longisporum TaxID=100787 RepID=A0A0G4MDB0_VERLO|nr:hypothetical protein BN1708_016051 [Verticillium longisporum]